MRFRAGDKVRVKDREGVTGNMKDMAGEVVTIKDNDWNSLSYQIHEDYGEYDWEWTDEMLEPIEDSLATKIEERNNKPSIQEQLEENLIELLDENDKVNSPSHYNKGDIEVIDIIRQLVQGYEPFEAYLVGNAIKYLARANFKENKRQDLEKSQWHINKLLEEEE